MHVFTTKFKGILLMAQWKRRSPNLKAMHCQLETNIVMLFATLVVISCSGSAQEIFTEMPSSINVVIGTNATFDCIVRAHSLAWFIDDEHVQVQHLTDRNISYTIHHNPLNDALQSTLTVVATEINNMSTVRCEAFVFDTDGNPTRSDPALLRIQDRLGAPRDFNVDSRTPGIILLTWSPPFTLDITDNDKDITHYSIYVNESGTIMQEIINVTEGLEYTFLCSQNGSYYFRVSGFNLAGEGKKSAAVIGTCIIPATVSTEEDNLSVVHFTGFIVGAVIIIVAATFIIVRSVHYMCHSLSSKKEKRTPEPEPPSMVRIQSDDKDTIPESDDEDAIPGLYITPL